jgi:hypothetical protein
MSSCPFSIVRFQIYSFANKLPMGSKTIYVDDQDSVRIENVSFNLVSNIRVQSQLIEQVDPIYKLHVRLRPMLNRLNFDQKDQVSFVR